MFFNYHTFQLFVLLILAFHLNSPFRYDSFLAASFGTVIYNKKYMLWFGARFLAHSF